MGDLIQRPTTIQSDQIHTLTCVVNAKWPRMDASSECNDWVQCNGCNVMGAIAGAAMTMVLSMLYAAEPGTQTELPPQKVPTTLLLTVQPIP